MKIQIEQNHRFAGFNYKTRVKANGSKTEVIKLLRRALEFAEEGNSDTVIKVRK